MYPCIRKLQPVSMPILFGDFDGDPASGDPSVQVGINNQMPSRIGVPSRRDRILAIVVAILLLDENRVVK